MSTPAPRPTGEERRFGAEEILVSKTDLKGHIEYVNDVFLRVCAYPAQELLGSPHNLIRHPDMPGGIYLLLWQTIQSGREVFAYLDNLAKDGCHYWVIAHVTPTFDAAGAIVGYHSNRRAPNRDALDEITGLYRHMRGLERGLPGPKAARESLAWLEGEIARREQTYEQFVWGLIDAGRDGRSGRGGYDRSGARAERGERDERRELSHV